MHEYLELFFTFAKIGAVTFGGGYAMLPILQREIVDSKHWVTEAEIMDYYAIGQCTPGIIAINVSTFVGKKQKGVLGGIAATLGMVFPSLIIITLIASLIHNFSDIAWVQNAFAGIRVCVCVLILNAVIKLWKSAVIDKITFLIFAAVFIGSVFLNLSPVLYVLLAGAAGILLSVLGVHKP
ncbi:MAG: chromate transporter [Fusicatenibacter sp.]|nr:chromate transporter [Lachnospiraceae bacterium]MDY2937914.1 chromate transporter [Fusicatenibacter sp.]